VGRTKGWTITPVTYTLLHMTTPPRDDLFTLFDLRVETIATDRPMVCNHPAGSGFTLRGENLEFPPGQTFPLYPLAALLPCCQPSSAPRTPTTG
jgi:hypothetical protein